MRPLPQSASLAQPQVPLAKQAAPVPSFEQELLSEAVHSTHFFSPLQTRPEGQSPSFAHCTQRLGFTLLSQAGVGASQSALAEHGAGRHSPIAPDLSLQYCPAGQSLRPAAVEHPAMQTPGELVVPLHTSPDPGGPHCASLVQPQTPSESMQMGFAPPHLNLLSELHSVHCPFNVPESLQTGREGSEQEGGPLDSQGSQVHEYGWQLGAVAGQCASVRHSTQMPVTFGLVMLPDRGLIQRLSPPPSSPEGKQ